MAEFSQATWPATLFRSPLLRGLDERGRQDVQRYGRLVELKAGESLFRAGEPSDCLFVVVRGQLELQVTLRGDETKSVVRSVEPEGSLGEEALVPGLERACEASCRQAALVAAVPMSVLSRALTRAGGASELEREIRQLRREVTRDLLRAQAFSRHLRGADLELLLDAVHFQSYAAGQHIYQQGEPALHCLLLQKGLVQIQSEREGRVRVQGYLSAGDFYGDEQLLSGDQHGYSAVALGDTVCIHASAEVLRSLCDRNPGLTKKLRRLTLLGRDEQAPPFSGETGTTQHVLKDVYRMQMARSLLAIDQDSCVRCGHCAWACAEVHGGVTRLIRSGDKIVVPAQDNADTALLSSLLLPNTCQHCEHPACMIDCPTGAIGRSPEGEVFVREALCTGCGACAKACPWQNIQLSPRTAASSKPAPRQPSQPELSALVAVKCDLCRDYAAPACVEACPTDALRRLDPRTEFEAVRSLFGARTHSSVTTRAARSRPRTARSAIVLSSLVLLGMLLSAPVAHSLGPSVALWSGVVAGVGVVVLAGHGFVKRGVRWWLRPRAQRGLLQRTRNQPPARSRVSPWLVVHQSVGLLTLGALCWHARLELVWGLSGLLLASLLLSALTGVLGAVSYKLVPKRLTRLEWRGALPEELRAEKAALDDRLYQLTSGQNEFFKKLAGVVLLPYSRSYLASLRLLCSGRDLQAERARLRAEIDSRLQGRGQARLAGLDELIKTVVDMRALPLRRGLTASLRCWQPVHAGLTICLLALLLLHVLAQVG